MDERSRQFNMEPNGNNFTDGTDSSAVSPVEPSKTPSEQSRPESLDGVNDGSNLGDGNHDREKPPSSDRSTPNRSGMRSTSSKFASLRATFEQTSSGDGIADIGRRRLNDSEKGNEMTAEQKQNYTTEIAKLKDELDKEKELRVAFEEKVNSLEEEVDELSEALEQRDEQWRSEFEQRSAQLMADANGRFDAAAKEARSRENEAANLQRQLMDLKQTVASSTKTTPQVSDTTFRQEIETLQHEVQNWVVNHFRRAKIVASAEELCKKLEKVAEAKHVESLKPIYETFDSGTKIPIYQATVACYMMEIFDEPYLFGLKEQESSKRSRQAADSLQDVFDPETFNRWRSMTFDSLRRSECINDPVETAASGISELICIALKALSDAEDGENWEATLKPILKRAISLAHLIRVQHAQYEYRFPSPGQTFDPDTMDDIAEDGEGDMERIVGCSTFPSLTKLCEDHAADTDKNQVVVKAKVLCR